jgi:XRE family aerobic/anaerobic benzoate catabolism transcriptional regulator
MHLTIRFGIEKKSGMKELEQRIGLRITEARKARAWTREQLADAADVSVRYLAQLEHGQANVSLGVLARVASSLGLELPRLLESDEVARRESADATSTYLPLTALLGSLDEAAQRRAFDILVGQRQELTKIRRGVALIGLRGAGKTTLGRVLAERADVPFVRLTAVVEEMAGMTVNELFSLGGPEAYRNLEIEAVARIGAEHARAVVETGGGLVANVGAFELVRATYFTVWLRASPEQHLARVRAQGDLRPMRGFDRAAEHIRSLLAGREATYARAHATLDTTGRTVRACTAELIRLTENALAAVDPAVSVA